MAALIRRLSLRTAIVLVVLASLATYFYLSSGDSSSEGPTETPSARPPGAAQGNSLCTDKQQPAPGVSVEGRRFVADGETWYPRALNTERFTAQGDLSFEDGLGVAASLERWDDQECKLMREFGANAIRIQIGQPSIDPDSSVYDPTYAAMIDRRIREALDSGFVVDLSLQWQKPDVTPKQPRPDRNSQQIWQQLATTWGDDTRVVFELYNEPNGPPTAQNWEIWLNGGPNSDNPSGQTVGIQTLIDTVRGAGAKNALLLPGLRLQKSLEGVPADEVVDPLNNFGFAFHTPDLTGGAEVLETRIGYLSEEYPLWATEQVGASPWNKCYEEMDEDYEWYFPWLVEHGIGVTSPWDRRSVWGETYGEELTSMEGFSCRPVREGISGPGELFNELFISGYPS